MDTVHLARFPFFKEATRFAAENRVDLERLLTSSAMAEARSRGKERVLEALELNEVSERPMLTDFDRLTEVMSYPLARMIVSAIGDNFLVRRYALAEAVAMNKRLQRESVEFVSEVAKELGVSVALVGEGLRMHFTDFLRLTSKMRSKEWKLVNTEVFKGYVYLPKQKFIRVLQQGLQDRLEGELPLDVNDTIVSSLATSIEEVRRDLEEKRKRFQANDMGRVSITRFPPCMKRLLAMTQAGENLPHSGRFALTSFLHTIGLSADDILQLFSASPDFDASKSRYQIQHITGEISGTEYTPPECSTMKSYGICFDPDRLCESEKMKHPLSYYRIKGFKGKRSGKKAQE